MSPDGNSRLPGRTPSGHRMAAAGSRTPAPLLRDQHLVEVLGAVVATPAAVARRAPRRSCPRRRPGRAAGRLALVVRSRAAAPAPPRGGRGCGASCRPSRSSSRRQPPLANQKTRLCSRKRPRIERTAIVSERPGTPGRRLQMRAHEQLDGHARLGREVEGVDDALVDDRVGLEADPRLGRPAWWCWISRWIRSMSPSRTDSGATSSESYVVFSESPDRLLNRWATSSPMASSAVSRPRSS